MNGTLHLFNLATTKTVVDRHSSSSMYPWWLIKSSRRGGGSKSAKFGCQKIPLWMEADKKIENHNDKTFKLERKHYGRYTSISLFLLLAFSRNGSITIIAEYKILNTRFLI